MNVNNRKKLKILFLNGHTSDYLGISLLHGLKSLQFAEVYDFPISEILYKEYQEQLRNKIRGKGFSLFFLLENKYMNRFHLTYNRIRDSEFDLIILNDIKGSFGLYLELFPYLDKKKTAILDGADSPALYPYDGNYWRQRIYWFLPRAHNRFLYFKREWTDKTYYYRSFKLFPPKLAKFLFPLKNLRQISFSIPEEKIIKSLTVKQKMFPKHIVDEEIASIVEDSSTSYAFESEEEYYMDLANSEYGITTKRSGWDCMRHYEIAANGAVICFKDLLRKPINSAPHGLIPGTNCISYKNYDDLRLQIKKINPDEYKKLQFACWEWAKKNSTKNKALSLLNAMGYKTV